MKTATLKFAGLVLLVLAAVLFTLPTRLFAQVDWSVGDVFAATGTGSYEVWHSSNLAAKNPTYTNIQTINDGTAQGGSTNGGATAGCAFDLAYRFFGTNLTNTLVDRYAIDNGDNNHSIVQQLAHNPIDSGSATQSVVFDAGKNLFVGYSGGASGGNGTIEQWVKDTNPADFATTLGRYTFLTSFSVPIDNSGPGWIDLAADGVTIFYTSQGRKIYQFNSMTLVSSVWADLSTLSGNEASGTLHAIKILGPNYDGTNGVLVADQGNVKLVMASGGVITSVQEFKFKQNTNLQALALDAFNPTTTFWVGDASTNNLFQFNMSTGKTIVTLNTGNGTSLGGVCVDGGFSGAELNSRHVNSQTLAFTPANNTQSFTSGFTGAVFTATLLNLGNNVTATVRDSLVDPSLAISEPTVFSFNPGNPNSGTSTVPGNIICDQTLTSLGGFPNTCEIIEFEANPNSGFSASSVVINGPGNLPEATTNLRLLRNLDEDITDDIDLSGTRSNCVYTVNQQTSDSAFQICDGGFSAPAGGQNFVKNQTANIDFKFNVSPTGQCPSGKSPTNLQPLLMIVQNQPAPGNGQPTPAPVVIPVIVAGNSGGPAFFILSGNTWQLQVKTTNMQAGFTYVATMVDLTATIPSISVTFSLK